MRAALCSPKLSASMIRAVLQKISFRRFFQQNVFVKKVLLIIYLDCFNSIEKTTSRLICWNRSCVADVSAPINQIMNRVEVEKESREKQESDLYYCLYAYLSLSHWFIQLTSSAKITAMFIIEEKKQLNRCTARY